PADPNAPARFAVDLFDPAESNIAPGSPAAIEALGGGGSGAAAGSASPGPSASASTTPVASPSPSAPAGAAAAERPNARDEVWVRIGLIVLFVRMAAWLVSQRDAVLRLWRGFRARLAGRGSA